MGDAGGHLQGVKLAAQPQLIALRVTNFAVRRFMPAAV